MRSLLAFLVAGAGIFVTASIPLAAHHSFAAEFDATKAVSLQGVVTKLDWMNPHIWIYLDTKDESGTVVHWQCEGGPPNTLTRQGWSKDSLKVGDQASIDGFRSKDGTNTCNARSVKLPNGNRVFAGSAEDGGPSKRPPAQ
ncbi:MAG: hypothetical protein JOZ32_06685 [Bryobacterales bacterium]|nr:hypothetical protein [Bryobacterales bacterium]